MRLRDLVFYAFIIACAGSIAYAVGVMIIRVGDIVSAALALGVR